MPKAAGMNALRAIAVLLSVVVHGTIGYAVLPELQNSNIAALDLGKGMDVMLVQGAEPSETTQSGQAAEEQEEQREVIAMQAAPPPPPEEKKPDELRDLISSDASEVQSEAVKTEDPPPPPDTPPPPPETAQMVNQPEIAARVQEVRATGQAAGGDAKAFGRYLGQINDHVQRAKINPRSSVAGTVVMRFTVDVDGKLLSKEVATSSGSKLLDDAATAALDRAAPFPPIPPEISIKPLAFTQPFKFIMR